MMLSMSTRRRSSSFGSPCQWTKNDGDGTVSLKEVASINKTRSRDENLSGNYHDAGC